MAKTSALDGRSQLHKDARALLDQIRRVFPTERSPACVLATLREGLGTLYWRGPDLRSLATPARHPE